VGRWAERRRKLQTVDPWQDCYPSAPARSGGHRLRSELLAKDRVPRGTEVACAQGTSLQQQGGRAMVLTGMRRRRRSYERAIGVVRLVSDC